MAADAGDEEGAEAGGGGDEEAGGVAADDDDEDTADDAGAGPSVTGAVTVTGGGIAICPARLDF